MDKDNTFVLYRILGNDLSPRHKKGQTLENTEFILKYEPFLIKCNKRWVVNRIVDSEYEKAILKLLNKYNQKYIHIPFIQEEYTRIDFDFQGFFEFKFHDKQYIKTLNFDQRKLENYLYRYKILYVMNNNKARNIALCEGRTLAKWVLPWDGNCFLTKNAWAKIVDDVESFENNKYFIVPMSRVLNNELLLDLNFNQNPTEEPQIIFRRDAKEEFDENRWYSNRPKAELLSRLSVPGVWNQWGLQPWEKEKKQLLSKSEQFHFTGWVARLFSGVSECEQDVSKRVEIRFYAIKEFLNDLDEQIVSQTLSKNNLLIYNEVNLLKTRQAWQSGDSEVFELISHLLLVVKNINDEQKCFQLMVDYTIQLAIAWYFTGDEQYAIRATKLVRIWLIELAIYINPHLGSAKCKKQSETTYYQILKNTNFYVLLDAIVILSPSGYWTTSDDESLKFLCLNFLNWLQDNNQNTNQNKQSIHINTHSLLVASLAAFIHDIRTLIHVVQHSKLLLMQQFEQNATQSLQKNRSDVFSCYVLNLQVWVNLAQISQHIGIDLWKFQYQDQQIFAKLFQWLLPYYQKPWTYNQSSNFDIQRLLPLYYVACHQYPELQFEIDTSTIISKYQVQPTFSHEFKIIPYWLFSL
ncbi:alginate lyase family protein [Desmonostoc muscorum LEGE 12446]|uniref:alginate lyase family protein n=1 Tax=Desmonostoc muscorum TaxID=1179 RepID=UPI001F238A5D|nr:alginate lyase family protein [Desmonostoc muscorum]MCF2152071.1 alginate lyase family protein [Desmonostoc muscorum LEGE 12446]